MNKTMLFLCFLLISMIGFAQDLIREFQAPVDSSIFFMGSEEFNNNYYVVGKLNKKQDIRSASIQILCKIDKSLQAVWIKKISTRGALFDIIKDENGGFVVCGESADSLGQVFPYIAKIDTNGFIIWSKTVGKMCPNNNVEARFYKIKRSKGNFIVIGGIINDSDTLSSSAYILNTNGDSILLVSVNTHSSNSLNFANHSIDAIELKDNLIFTGRSGENGTVFIYNRLSNTSKFISYSKFLNDYFDIYVNKIYNVAVINDTINLFCDFYKSYFFPPNFPFYQVKTFGLIKVDSAFNYLGHRFLSDSIDNKISNQLSWIHNINDTIIQDFYIGFNYNLERNGNIFSNSEFCLLKMNTVGAIKSKKVINFNGYQFMYEYQETFNKKVLITGNSIQNNIEYNGILVLVDTNNFVGICDEKKSLNVLTIFPNPAKTVLCIQSGKTDYANAAINIYNSLGQLVSREKSFQNAINIEWLLPGIYYLTVFDKSAIYQAKFIKQ